MAAFARTELDLVGMARQDNQAAMTLFVIRDGKMIGRDVYLLDAVREASDDEVLASFLEQYYARATSIPREVYVPAGVAEGMADLETFLAEKRGGPVHLRVPQRGEKRELMELAARNAAETLAREHARWLADQGKTLAALEELAEALGLPGPPLRIECYDISNFQGAESVGSMVVFEEGKPRTRRVPPVPDQDRRRARTTSPATRRCCAAASGSTRSGEEGSEEERRWAMPDLVIIDGGKGQVSAAKDVLDELGLHDLPLAGLAKEREELFLPGSRRADRAAADVVGALPGPAAARRGAPVRDHLPPLAARPADGPVRVRRPAGRRPEAQARAAEGVRLDQAGARGAGRADRGGAGHQPGAGRAHQGHAGGLTGRTRIERLQASAGRYRVPSRRYA